MTLQMSAQCLCLLFTARAADGARSARTVRERAATSLQLLGRLAFLLALAAALGGRVFARHGLSRADTCIELSLSMPLCR